MSFLPEISSRGTNGWTLVVLTGSPGGSSHAQKVCRCPGRCSGVTASQSLTSDRRARAGNRDSRPEGHIATSSRGHIDLLVAIAAAFGSYRRIWVVQPSIRARILEKQGE